jgi:hypothetical protein
MKAHMSNDQSEPGKSHRTGSNDNSCRQSTDEQTKVRSEEQYRAIRIDAVLKLTSEPN